MLSRIEQQAMDAIIGMHKEIGDIKDAILGILKDKQKRNDEVWEQRRFEIAKGAMCSMLSNPELVDGITKEGEPTWHTEAPIAEISVKFADLLIEELQKTDAKREAILSYAQSAGLLKKEKNNSHE